MLKAKWLQITLYWLLCVFAVVIQFSYLISSYVIGLIVLCWLLQANFKETIYNLKIRKALWPWLLFFLLHLVSYSYSENKDQSAFDISSKLVFVLIPVIIGAGVIIERKWLERIMLFFTAGISVLTVYCIVNAVFKCVQEGYLYKPFFFYHDLVSGLDPNAVYMALYTLFSITLLLFYPWQQFFVDKYKYMKWAMVAIQVCFFILLSSRLLIVLFFLLLIPIYLKRLLIYRKMAWKQIGLIATACLLLASVLFATDNPIKRRFQDVFQKDLNIAFEKDYHNIPQKAFSNVTLRLMLWRFGIENMLEHNLWLTGAGNGDAIDLQNEKMAQYGIDVYNPDPKLRSEFYNINLHNMWFQALLMLGIPGLLLFCIISLSPVLKIKFDKLQVVFIIFQISILFFMFQEASLQTQAGVMYYTFFSLIFWNIYYNKQELSTKEL